MSVIKPFRGLRPRKELAARVAAPPYDVLSSEEAREMARDNPISYLHINKPEIDLDPHISLYDQRVYQKGAENLKRLVAEKVVFQDPQPCLYIYRQIMGDHQQTGLVACASVEEYQKDLIKKHELTRQDKEDDRLQHMIHLNAQVGPVFLTYRARPEIDAMVARIVEQPPEYDFVTENSVRHILWVVNDAAMIAKFQSAFREIPALYVADGHHRSAAATRFKQMRQKENPDHQGTEEYNFFLSVIFPHNQMQILDYNRVVKDLNGMDATAFLQQVEKEFRVEPAPTAAPLKPAAAHQFGMYLAGKWYSLKCRQAPDDPNPVNRLDVSLLQNRLLKPLLGIGDPRTDQRIDFVGGIRGLKALQEKVDSGKWAVAFAFYPTSIEELMTIADAGKMMPPKSTWFEPKLRSGLVVHLLD